MDTTVIFPKPGVTVFLPGGVGGFKDSETGLAVRNEHAAALLMAGGVETVAQRKARRDLEAAEGEKAAAGKAATAAEAASDGKPAAAADGKPAAA